MQVQPQRRLQRGQGHLVAAQCAHQRILLDLLNPHLLAGDDTRLRPAEQLVAAEQHQVGTRRDAVPRHRLAVEAEALEVDEGAAADVVDHRDAVLLAQRHQLRQRRRLGEAGHAVVAGVDPQQRRRVGAEGALVVGDAGDVGGADLPEDSAADDQDFRDAEAAADLDELAARDDDLAALAQRPQRDHRGRGVVVDDRG